jgi:glucosamine--fructose-6-phosphate aminotransferase (isomerizing)
VCGIIGYAGRQPASRVLVDALRRLEYRGYDSAGLATVDGGRLHILKLQGRVQGLSDLVSRRPPGGTTGIGHTRWATHGVPSTRNAHPHLDCHGRIAVIHNGIIENFSPLKDRLERQGHRFRSETDTELVAHLIEAEYRGSLEKALRAVVRHLKGQSVLVAVSRDEPGLVVGFRQGTPLLIGLSKEANFLASGIPAFLPWTRRFLPVADGEMALITPEDARLVDAAGRPVHRRAETADWNLNQAEKEGYPTFMLKEIHEQPKALLDTLQGRATPTGTGDLGRELDLSPKTLSRLDRVHLVACGTAWHAALVGRHWIETVARIPATAEIASEFRYADPVLTPRSLVVAITQSGETADTLGAVTLARKRGARVLAVCNVVGSSIPRASHATLMTRAGPEIGVASTKAYTTQLLALMLFAVHLGLARRSAPGALARTLLKGLLDTPRLARLALRSGPDVSRLARRLRRARNVFFLGRHVNGATALEGALKLKEISYVHAEGYHGGEMKHGPLALVEPGLPVIALLPDGPVYDKMLSNLQEVRARRGDPIAVATAGNRRLARWASSVLPVPRCHPLISPLPAIIPLQLFAYEMARLRGRDIDHPRNLAKSVTVE